LFGGSDNVAPPPPPPPPPQRPNFQEHQSSAGTYYGDDETEGMYDGGGASGSKLKPLGESLGDFPFDDVDPPTAGTRGNIDDMAEAGVISTCFESLEAHAPQHGASHSFDLDKEVQGLDELRKLAPAHFSSPPSISVSSPHYSSTAQSPPKSAGSSSASSPPDAIGVGGWGSQQGPSSSTSPNDGSGQSASGGGSPGSPWTPEVETMGGVETGTRRLVEAEAVAMRRAATKQAAGIKREASLSAMQRQREAERQAAAIKRQAVQEAVAIRRQAYEKGGEIEQAARRKLTQVNFENNKVRNSPPASPTVGPMGPNVGPPNVGARSPGRYLAVNYWRCVCRC
jgi:hypothetical protein